jgi:hypothetical protein
LAAVLFVAVFLAGVDLAVVFLAVVVLAVVDLAAVLLAGDDLVVVFLAVVDFVVVDLAVDFFAAVDLAAVLLAGDDFVVVALFAGVDFAAVFFADADLVAVDFLAGVAAVLLVDFLATALTGDGLGSFLSPDTTALNSAPGRNLGTADFLTRTRSPVRGLRTFLAGRTIFSKAPKPVMATFSPRATSRAMVSTTASSASDATFLLSANCAASVSMNWDLFTGFPS